MIVMVVVKYNRKKDKAQVDVGTMMETGAGGWNGRAQNTKMVPSLEKPIIELSIRRFPSKYLTFLT